MRRGQASQGLGPSPLSRGVEEAPLKLGDVAGELTLQPEGSGGNGGGVSGLRADLEPLPGHRAWQTRCPGGLILSTQLALT